VGLFSDVDWLIVLGVGAFLLLGQDGGRTVRQLGRWYGRALRLKHELVSEVARAADLPVPADASGASLRTALLGAELGPQARAELSIPLVGRTGPIATGPVPAQPFASTGGYAVTSWTPTFFEGPDTERRS